MVDVRPLAIVLEVFATVGGRDSGVIIRSLKNNSIHQEISFLIITLFEYE